MYTTTYLIDKQQDLLHSTGNYTQHLVIITYNRTNLKSFICICVYIYMSEKAMATHSSTLAWKIPWMEEPGRLQSMGLPRVRHDWSDFTFTFHFHIYMCIYIYTYITKSFCYMQETNTTFSVNYNSTAKSKITKKRR